MSTMAPSHITIDENGIARILGTEIKVIHVAAAHRFHHLTPHQMREHWSHLSLAQLHFALSYYYDHQAKLNAEIDRSSALAANHRAAG